MKDNINSHKVTQSSSITININENNSIKTITHHISPVNSILLLKDHRIASCSNDKTIGIYAPSKDYHCEQMIKRHNYRFNSICEIEDGNIVSCLWDQSIMIGDYTIKKAHENWINKVITLSNNRIASCSEDGTRKI